MAHKHPIYDTDKHFVIDPITKKISTESTKLLLAQHSHNSERFTFEIPKEIEGHDMSLCNLVEIHYLNIDAANKSTKHADIYKVEDLQTGTDDTADIVFGSWLISGNATQYVGNLNFAIRFACIADDGTVDYSWPTLVYSNITIGETIWNAETIIEQYADIITQFEARVQALEDSSGISSNVVKSVNGISPDEDGNVEIDIPEVDLSEYAKTEDIPTIPENIVQTVNGVAPDENGNVEITIPDYGGNVDQSGASVYIGSEQPTDGTLYWLDTSEDEVVHTHAYTSEVTTAATCTADGVMTHTCSCGGTYTEVIAATGHNYVDGVCTVCGAADPDAETGGEDEPETVTYTVTNTLTNVTNNNSATSVDENASYTATLTAADGYNLDTVTVTMGGTDVTSTVYADGVVTISAVTGNVVITAVASKELSGTTVEMQDASSGLLTFYTDGGESEGTQISKARIRSTKTFDTDTTVSYQFTRETTDYGSICAGSYNVSDGCYYYAEGVPKTTAYYVAGEYTGTYTVRAGHQFAIFGMASSATILDLNVVE